MTPSLRNRQAAVFGPGPLSGEKLGVSQELLRRGICHRSEREFGRWPVSFWRPFRSSLFLVGWLCFGILLFCVGFWLVLSG